MEEPSEFLYLNNWEDFQPIFTPVCNFNVSKHFILVLIKSAPDRYKV